MPDGTCVFAVVDVADLDGVIGLQRLLRDHGIPAIVLRSRQKGYHVTVFLTEPMEAAPIRRVLRSLLIEAGLPAKTEIYPKVDHPAQESKAAGGKIRLPYLAACPRSARTDAGRGTWPNPDGVWPSV